MKDSNNKICQVVVLQTFSLNDLFQEKMLIMIFPGLLNWYFPLTVFVCQLN